MASMPDFLMPPEPLVAPSDDQGRPGPGQNPVDLTSAVGEGPLTLPSAVAAISRARLLRALTATLLIGALAGGVGVAAIARALERTTDDTDRASLEVVADAYLTAIAEGRAADANTLVPTERRDALLLSDAVLGSAQHIGEPAVQLVHIDGDRGWIDVQYRFGHVDVVRTLDAVRDVDSWQVTTSLAEPVRAAWWMPVDVRVAGQAVHEAELLYPGIYTTDEFDDGVVTFASTSISVDGDPDTAAEVIVEPEVHPALDVRLGAAATEYLEACRASGACEIGQGSLAPSAFAEVNGFDGHGAAEVGVIVMRSDLPATVEPLHVGVRGNMLGDDQEWVCGLLDFGLQIVLDWTRCMP